MRLARAAGQHDDAGAAVPEGRRRPRAGRCAAPSRSSSSSIGCASPSTYPARSSAGQPSLSSACLRLPRSLGCTATVSSSTRGRACLRPSWRAAPPRAPPGRSSQHQAVHGVLPSRSRPYGPSSPRRRRAARAARGSGELQQGVDDLLGVVAGGAGVPQAERREPVGVDVLGARSSSANGAIALRHSAAGSWSTSSSRVLSLCTISGPSVTQRV